MSGLIDRLYSDSPIWIQQAMVAAYGWWWYRRRYSEHFFRLVAEYKSREFWMANQFQNYTEIQLDKLLNTAWGSPYYRQVFLEAGVKKGVAPMDALARLPFLSKETLRTRPKDLLTSDPAPKGVIVQTTSGTTGSPTEIHYTREFHAAELAVPEARNLNWAGVNYRNRRVMLGIRKVCRFDQDRPPFWRFSPMEDMAYASIFHLSPKYLPHYVAFLREYKPSVIMGYPSALNVIARYALENNDLPAPAKGVFTTSETVTAQFREAVEAAWQCRIYDRYGSVENAFFASECEHGRYHVSPEVGVIEIVDKDGRHCPPGKMGEVICTGLQNTLQPLIRYRTGDVAAWSSEQHCPCGRNMPILESVEGRYEDMCYTADGRRLRSCFDTVFKGVDNIKEAQVAQERLDTFVVRIVPSNHFNKQDAEKIKSNMRIHVGDVQTLVEIVPAIKRTQSGKFKAMVCNLSQEERRAVEKLSEWST
jgi:phenylacetate-CoA ligase